MARLDIWLPAWNREASLPAALRSLRRQTFRDWRLIAVDDGSSDRTADLLDGFGATVIRLPHGGIVAALRAAARASDAPLVARMDADDLCHRQRFELQLAVKADVVATRVRVTGPEGIRLYARWQNALVTHDEIVRSLFIESPIAHPSVLFSRNAYERAGGYRDVDWPEDYDLWFRMREGGARFAKVPRALVAWRDRPDRLTRTHAMYSPKAIRAAKLHYLARDPILKRGPVTLWGAGDTGRPWIRDLLALGVDVVQAIDIDPRKIGRVAAGVPVRTPDDALARRHGLILAAVGARGARDLIRAHLEARSLREGSDFLFLA
jgi:glycosyltransferase involved in cell wall biosynthesis